MAVGTRSRGAASAIHIFPKRSGTGKCESSRTCKKWKLRESRSGRPDHGNALDKSLKTRSLRGFCVHGDPHPSRTCPCSWVKLQAVDYATRQMHARTTQCKKLMSSVLCLTVIYRAPAQRKYAGTNLRRHRHSGCLQPIQSTALN